jgi:ABC-2 type transport system permease protein
MYRAKSMEELPVSFAGLALLEDEQFSNAVWDRHFPKLWDRMQQQATALQDLSWLLPSLAMRSVSMGLCGTDPAHHISFSAAAEKYRRNLVYQMNTSLANRGAGKDMAYRADRKLWESLPRFHWDGPSTDQILNRNQPALAAVPGWLILSIAFAIVASLRVQPLD